LKYFLFIYEVITWEKRKKKLCYSVVALLRGSPPIGLCRQSPGRFGILMSVRARTAGQEEQEHLNQGVFGVKQILFSYLSYSICCQTNIPHID